MLAWVVDDPAPIDEEPLSRRELPLPEPGPGEVRVKVHTCGVCRTDLHIVEGDLAAHSPRVIPGHEIVGVIDRIGEGVTRFVIGERIGIAWLRHTCGVCRFCLRDAENLCISPAFTGWDADGGYAEYAVAPAAYAYRIPQSFSDEKAAPLLCAGIIGYRALRRTMLRPGGALGIYGFGASAHLAAQIAIFEGAAVHVMTRSRSARDLALELGASSAQGFDDTPPEPLDAAISFAPVGDAVSVGLTALDRGGTLVIAGIHLSDIPPLNYERTLFEERSLRSVTANTRRDGEEFLALAERASVRVITTPYRLSQAGDALRDLAHDAVRGAAVLVA